MQRNRSFVANAALAPSIPPPPGQVSTRVMAKRLARLSASDLNTREDNPSPPTGKLKQRREHQVASLGIKMAQPGYQSTNVLQRGTKVPYKVRTIVS